MTESGPHSPSFLRKHFPNNKPYKHEVTMGSHKAKWKKQASNGALTDCAREAPPQSQPTWDNIKHFTPRDFTCQCAGLCDHPVVISLEMVAKLDQICDVIGLPIKVLSGKRCERYNSRVSGQGRSAHLPKDGVSHAAHISCP